MRIVKLNARNSASLVIREVTIFWEKARIPTKQSQHCISKLLKMYGEWGDLQKNNKKDGSVFREREALFSNNLENLFDVSHADALSMVKIEEDWHFLLSQRQPGRVGYMSGVDYNLTQIEKKREKRKQEELNRQQNHLNNKRPRNCSENLFEDDSDEQDEQYEQNEQNEQDEEIAESISTASYPESAVTKRATKHFITPKLVAVLDRCRVSARNAVFILQAAAEALGHKLDNLIITKTSIQQQRAKLRCARAQDLKAKFKELNQPFLVVHWDGKLLPALSK